MCCIITKCASFSISDRRVPFEYVVAEPERQPTPYLLYCSQWPLVDDDGSTKKQTKFILNFEF